MSAIEEMTKALNCLYIALDESVAEAIGQKVRAAIAEKDKEIARLKSVYSESCQASQAVVAGKDKEISKLKDALADKERHISEAKILIQQIGTASIGDGAVIRAANQWMKTKP